MSHKKKNSKVAKTAKMDIMNLPNFDVPITRIAPPTASLPTITEGGKPTGMVQTLPYEMKDYKPVFHQVARNIMVFARECLQNAADWQASKAHMAIINYNDMAYVVIAHDGDPFQNLEDILQTGVNIGYSARNGDALNGMGPKAVSAYMSDHPDFIVASHCKDKDFFAARGRPQFSTSEWKRLNCTEECKAILQERLGEKIFNKYNVFYLAHVDLNGDPSNIFNGSLCTTLGQWLGGTLDKFMKVTYSEVGIGFEDRSETYKSLTLTSNQAREVCGKLEFDKRFLRDGHCFKLPAKNVRVTVRQSPQTDLILDVMLTVKVFDGKIVGGEETPMHDISGGSRRMGNVRNLTIEKDGIKGEVGRAGIKGTPPKDRVFFFASCDGNALRYKSQPIFSAQNTDYGIMSNLGMRTCLKPNQNKHGSNGKPFVILEFDVVNVKKTFIEDETGDLRESASAGARDFMKHLSIRGDFFSRDHDAINKVIYAACSKIVQENSSEYNALKSLVASYFPVSDAEWLSLYNDEVSTKAMKDHPLCFINLESGEEIGSPASNNKLHTDTDCYCVIYNRKTGVGISPDTLFSGSTRGIKMNDASEEMARRNNKHIAKNYANVLERLTANGATGIRPLVLQISPFQRFDDKEGWIDIEREEYEKTSAFRPSRGVSILYETMTPRIGVIEDVPASPLKDTNGGGHKNGTHKAPNDPSHKACIDSYFDGPESVVLDYSPNEQVVKWNKNNPWVCQLFKISEASVPPSYVKAAKELSQKVTNLARLMFTRILHPDPFSKYGQTVNSVLMQEHEDFGDFNTLAINRVVLPWLAADTDAKKLIDKMRQELGNDGNDVVADVRLEELPDEDL